MDLIEFIEGISLNNSGYVIKKYVFKNVIKVNVAANGKNKYLMMLMILILFYIQKILIILNI